MGDIEWAEPPSGAARGHYDTTGESKYVHFGRELRERPGEWARITTGARTAATHYAKKHMGDGFEITARKVAPENYDIYARYVGDE